MELRRTFIEVQERMDDRIVRLPRGVTLALPTGWRADREPLTTTLASGTGDVDARELSAEPDGFLVTFATPSTAPELITLTVARFVGGLNQEVIAKMDTTRVHRLGEEEFHDELARVTRLAGNMLTGWGGLVKRPVAGLDALEMSYLFRTPSSPELISRTLMFFRGFHSFRLQFVHARPVSSGVDDTIDRILLNLMVEG